MRSFRGIYDVTDPREAIAARNEGVRWFLTFGLRLNELGVRLDPDLSNDPGLAADKQDPRIMKFTIRADLEKFGSVLVMYNPFNNVARLTAQLNNPKHSIRAFVTSNLEGLNVLPRPTHKETIGLKLNDPSPFKMHFLQRCRLRYDLHDENVVTKLTARHRRVSMTGTFNMHLGPSVEMALHVRSRQILTLRCRPKTHWQLRWKSVENDEPFSISLQVPTRLSSWEDRWDAVVLTLRKRFAIDGIHLLEEMTQP